MGIEVRETSVAAFQSLTEKWMRTIRGQICLYLVAGPSTARGIGEAIHRDLQSVTPRISELERDGLIEIRGTDRNETTDKLAQLVYLTHAGFRVVNGESPPPKNPTKPKLITLDTFGAIASNI